MACKKTFLKGSFPVRCIPSMTILTPREENYDQFRRAGGERFKFAKLPGQPKTENGNRPEENHVSKTSESCSTRILAGSTLGYFARASDIAHSGDFAAIQLDESSQTLKMNNKKITYVWPRLSIDNYQEGRTPMPPPQLSRNAPVMNVLQPSEPGITVNGRQQLQFPITNNFHGLLSHRFAIDPPETDLGW